MKKTQRLLAAFLAVVMAFICISLPVSADTYKTINGIRYVYDNNGKQKGKYTGWETVGKNKYYYINGVKIKDTWLSQTYLFDNDGKMLTGDVRKDDKYYTLGDDGKLICGVEVKSSDAGRIGITLDFKSLSVGDKKTQVYTTDVYKLEYKVSGKWVEYPAIKAAKFKNKTYKLITSGKLKSRTETINWQKTNGTLPFGEYRVVKSYYIKTTSSSKAVEKVLYFTFKIKSASPAETKWGIVLSGTNVTADGMTLTTEQTDRNTGYVHWIDIYTLDYLDKKGKWREVDIEGRVNAEKNGYFTDNVYYFGKENDAKGKAGGTRTEKVKFYSGTLSPGHYRIKRIFMGKCNNINGNFYGIFEFDIK